MYRWLYIVGFFVGLGWIGWWQGCAQSPSNLFLCYQASDCGLGQVCVNRTCAGTSAVVQETNTTGEDLQQNHLEKTVSAQENANDVTKQEDTSEVAKEDVTESSEPDSGVEEVSEHVSLESFSLDQDPCADKSKIKPEECNGFDDDCDGKIDNIAGTSEPLSDNCYEGLPGTLVQGSACRKGVTTCQDGKWGTCVGQVLPKQEICNSVDDDCNGKIDDNIPGTGKECVIPSQPGSNLLGECAKGRTFCENNQMVCRQINFPRAEECDGKDNDCDGKIDNVTRDCYTGPKNTADVGKCKKGKQACTNGVWETTCVGEVLPDQKENCDGLIDDNCDGQVDEGCTCLDKSTRPCGSNIGECKQGTQSCDKGKWKDCEKAGGPTSEKCDGKDNNCNGQIDESYPESGASCHVAGQKGICAEGKQTCAEGKLSCVVVNQPQPEVCNGKDDNCDGQIDEGVTNTYYRDADGDGYGNSNETKQGCQAPPGYVDKPGDCDDTDKNVNPGQTQYFSSARSNKSFDYNCNGKEDKEFPTRGDCNDKCQGAKPGFVVYMPDCGWDGPYLTNCSPGILGCRNTVEWRKQRCR